MEVKYGCSVRCVVSSYSFHFAARKTSPVLIAVGVGSIPQPVGTWLQENKTGNVRVRIHITLRRIRVTIVAVEM